MVASEHDPLVIRRVRDIGTKPLAPFDNLSPVHFCLLGVARSAAHAQALSPTDDADFDRHHVGEWVHHRWRRHGRRAGVSSGLRSADRLVWSGSTFWTWWGWARLVDMNRYKNYYLYNFV